MSITSFYLEILPYILISAGVILLLVLGVYWGMLYARVTRERARLLSLKQEWYQRRNELEQQRKRDVVEAVSKLMGLLDVELMLIDESLWLKSDALYRLKTLADICSHAGISFNVPREQFDHLFLALNDLPAKQRHAIECLLADLERLQRKGLLGLVPSREVNFNGAPTLADLWDHFRSHAERILVITPDRKLRIQITDEVVRSARSGCFILHPEELEALVARCAGCVPLAFEDGMPAKAAPHAAEASKKGTGQAIIRAI